jgi:hypothetical protein
MMASVVFEQLAILFRTSSEKGHLQHQPPAI